ncbi:NAD(P)/FAD-dependent oxidoreductase [Flavobacterium sp. WW92]|uniref:NAD(P)/FAD-dependent oxidoreductase n=1 Tax=unclassified Flavobacterium TaxID=196869 RepID=UPI002225ADF2|nr:MULTISPECIES: NAD(P)/FAD-dependent oxidoreductase [unclassified Flavobacterium]WDO14439.1 NAD(P)/FAD-dependent oxidoreductase [Flavobacterium sp. WW92]
MKNKKAIIIGGGPAGLTAAYEFIQNTDIQPIVLEQSEFWGGISRTVNYKGNRIDIGGHRFFSKSDVIMDWWCKILPILSEEKTIKISYQNKSKELNTIDFPSEGKNLDNVMLVRSRKSRIYYQKQFFDYPISLTPETVLKLGLFNTFLIGMSYLKSVAFPIKDEKNLEDFFINRFGKKLYKTFFKDYTEKVWGIKCTEISSEWGAQRIKGLSIRKSVAHFLNKKFSKKKDKNISQKDTETSLIEYFLYPKFGPGQMWEEVARKVVENKGELHQNLKVLKIETQGDKIVSVTAQNQLTKEEVVFEGDYFISTMPVQELIASLETEVPQNVNEIAEGLVYRDFITVGLLLKKMTKEEITDNWIYIQEPYVKVGRLQIFNNWSPFLVKDETTKWVGLEYFCYEGDDLWNKSEDDMKQLAIDEMVEIGMIRRQDVLDSVVIKMPKTYPAYFGTYEKFNEIIDYTNQFENLFLIGRNGMHKYNNQDHSMLTAIQAVQNIKNGVSSKDNIWAINTEQEYHEEK